LVRIAVGHGGAAEDQYKPGEGCGDKNHQHARHNECKDQGDGGGNQGGGKGTRLVGRPRARLLACAERGIRGHEPCSVSPG
jgi:hypothetical protein